MSKSNKIMIQVCLCGAGTKKAQAPTVPYTADELAEQIVACAKAGASIAHIHDREDRCYRSGGTFQEDRNQVLHQLSVSAFKGAQLKR